VKVGDLPLVGAKRALLLADLMRLREAGAKNVPIEVLPGFRRPDGWPRGELLCVNCDGNQVVLYSIERLIRWMDRDVIGRSLR
jgi:hypothetical protein